MSRVDSVNSPNPPSQRKRDPIWQRWGSKLDRWFARQSESARQTHHQPIDNRIKVISPENIGFDYQVVGLFPRGFAFLIDIVILIISLMILNLLFVLITVLLDAIGWTSLAELFSTITSGLNGVFFFVSWWFYGALFETFMNGQTFGKRALGLRVVTTNGNPISGLQATLRNIARFADVFPWVSIQFFDPWITPIISDLFGLSGSLPWFPLFPTFLVALAAMIMSPRYQRLGDLVSFTMVIKEQRAWNHGLAKLEDARVPHLAEYIPASFVISQSLAKTLATYVDRRKIFSLGRRNEMARHIAEPLLEQFNLPPDTSYDLFMCALYHRAFVADQGLEDTPDLRLNQQTRQFEGYADPRLFQHQAQTPTNPNGLPLAAQVGNSPNHSNQPYPGQMPYNPAINPPSPYGQDSSGYPNPGPQSNYPGQPPNQP